MTSDTHSSPLLPLNQEKESNGFPSKGIQSADDASTDPLFHSTNDEKSAKEYQRDGNGSKMNLYSQLSPTDVHHSKRRYCCGCFQSKRMCWIVWMAVLLIALTGLSVLGFYVFPRKPTVNLSEPFFSNSTSNFNTTGTASSASDTNPFKLMFTMNVNATIFSPNLIDYDVQFIRFKGKLVDKNDAIIPNMEGFAQIDNVIFKRQSNTTLIVPIILTYSITKPLNNVLQESTLAQLVSSCALKPDEKIKMTYDLQVLPRLIAFTGFIPSFKGNLTVPCTPFTKINDVV